LWPLRPFHRTPSRGGPWPQGRTDILLAALNGRLGAVRHILRTPGAVASKAEVDASVSGLSALMETVLWADFRLLRKSM